MARISNGRRFSLFVRMGNKMETRYIQERITQLRIEKGVSEYQMSLDLGQSKGYIQSISSGRTMPSMGQFLNICEYLSITPKEFFNAETESPRLYGEVLKRLKKLEEEDINMVIKVAEHLLSIKEERSKR